MDNVEKVAKAMFRSAFGDDPLGDKAAERLFEDHRFEYENLAQAALQSIGYEPDTVPVRRDVVAFLDGSGDLDGVWFGDPKPANERGSFWWRKYLPALKGDSDRAALNRGEVG